MFLFVEALFFIIYFVEGKKQEERKEELKV